MRRAFLSLAVCMVLTGCLKATNKHYQITDTATGDVYYTRAINNVDDGKRNKPQEKGVIQFVNPLDGQRVQLQDPKIVEIPKEEYHSAVYGE